MIQKWSGQNGIVSDVSFVSYYLDHGAGLQIIWQLSDYINEINNIMTAVIKYCIGMGMGNEIRTTAHTAQTLQGKCPIHKWPPGWNPTAGFELDPKMDLIPPIQYTLKTVPIQKNFNEQCLKATLSRDRIAHSTFNVTINCTFTLTSLESMSYRILSTTYVHNGKKCR
jgi:hypothetical protein